MTTKPKRISGQLSVPSVDDGIKSHNLEERGCLKLWLLSLAPPDKSAADCLLFLQFARACKEEILTNGPQQGKSRKTIRCLSGDVYPKCKE